MKASGNIPRWEQEDVLLTPSDAGRILGVTPEAVRAMNNKGQLPALKTLGGRRLFRRCDVELLAAQRAAKAGRKHGTAQR
jgi:excisionase family DNA binding protein